MSASGVASGSRLKNTRPHISSTRTGIRPSVLLSSFSPNASPSGTPISVPSKR